MTVYLEAEVDRALRGRAISTGESISEIVNDAVRLLLAEDCLDVRAFASRKSEPARNFATVVRGLKRRGHI